jgi:hypothetical protein
VLLFWSLFLPLGVVWSLDAGRHRETKTKGYAQVISIASAAIMLQVAMMYLFSGIAKWNEVWLRGEALSLALQLDMYVRPLGRQLLAYPQILMLATFVTLLLECTGPLLLWMPIKNASWRLSLMIMFWLLHLGIWYTMSIGIFSAVAMLSWAVFLPREFWEFFRSEERGRPGLRGSNAAIGPPRILRLNLPASIVCGVFLVYVAAMNVANMNPGKSKAWFGDALRKFGNATMTLQQFTMFDRPAAENLWWRLVYTNVDGSRMDVLQPVPAKVTDLSQVPDPDTTYFSMPDQFWRRLLFNLATIDFRDPHDRARLHQLRQRTGQVLWAMRNEERLFETSGPAELLCFRRSLTNDEWLPEPNWETWATVETRSAR